MKKVLPLLLLYELIEITRCYIACDILNCMPNGCTGESGLSCMLGCVSGYYYFQEDHGHYLTCQSCDTASNEIDCKNCGIGYYYENGNRGRKTGCIQCPVGCQICGNPYVCSAWCPPGCTTCNGTECTGCINQTPVNGVCLQIQCDLNCSDIGCDKSTGKCSICNNGYYLLLNICLACAAECATCVNFANNCSSCIQPYTFYNNTCFECVYPCKTCDRSPSDCLTCLTDEVAWKGSCICNYPCLTCQSTLTNCLTCESGYTLYDNICHICKSPCLTCKIELTECLSCVSGYIHYQNTCQICEQPCLSCQTTPTICLTCESGSYLFQDTCKTCSSPCQTCLTSIDCLSCQDGYTYYNNKCFICQQPCLKCSTSPTDCLTCKKNYELHDGQCQHSESNQTCSEYQERMKYSSNPQAKISNNGGQIIVSYLFNEDFYDPTFKRDNTYSCLTSELILTNQAFYPVSYNFTPIISTYNITNQQRNWSFIIDPSNSLRFTYPNVGKSITDYTGYCGYIFNITNSTIQSYYFRFSFTIDHHTNTISEMKVKPIDVIIQHRYNYPGSFYFYEFPYINVSIDISTSLEYKQNSKNLYAHQEVKICVTIIDDFLKTQHKFNLTDIQVYFTSPNILNYNAPAIQVQKDSKNFAIIKVKVPDISGDIKIVVSALAREGEKLPYLLAGGESQNYIVYSSQCALPCKTCETTPYHCLTCATDQIALNGLCKCSVPCQTCQTTLTSCLTCISGYSQYKDICHICQSPCLTCQQELTECSSCIEGYTYYNNKCFTCKSPCIQCSTSPTDCLTCKNNYKLHNGQCLHSETCWDYYERIHNGNINIEGKITTNSGFITVSILFNDDFEDPTFKRDGNYSCLTSELVQTNQAFFPLSYNSTPIISTYNITTQQRNWSFVITPSQYLRFTYPNVNKTEGHTTYTGYFGYSFNLTISSLLNSYTYYFTFSFTVSHYTEGYIYQERFQSMNNRIKQTDVGYYTQSDSNQPRFRSVIKYELIVSATTPQYWWSVSKSDIVQNLYVDQDIIISATLDYSLINSIRPENLTNLQVYFTSPNTLNYNAPVIQIIANDGLHFAFKVKVPKVWGNIKIVFSALWLVNDYYLTYVGGQSASLGCIRIAKGSNDCVSFFQQYLYEQWVMVTIMIILFF